MAEASTVALSDTSTGTSSDLKPAVTKLEPWTHPLSSVSLHQVLKSHPPGFRVVTFSESDSVRTVFARMAAASILSAPVIASSKVSSNRYVDLVDVYDLISFVMTAFDTEPQERGCTKADCVRNLSERVQAVLDQPLSVILSSEGKNEDIGFVSSVLQRDLQRTIDSIFFLRSRRLRFNRSHVHRVAVMDPEGGVRNILSMTDILRFIAANPKFLDPNASLPIASLPRFDGTPLASARPVSIPESTPAIDALTQIQATGMHCLVVVKEDGSFSTAISPADLRRVTVESLAKLALPVPEFLVEMAKHASPQGLGGAAGVPGRVLVDADTPLSEVVRRMLAGHAHYAVGVDDANKPLFVVTVTDLLRLFASPQ